MTEPVVSIIIPFYNPENYFEILLESIAAQTYKHIQVVLVDDGSKSDFNRMAKNFVELSSNRLLVTKKMVVLHRQDRLVLKCVQEIL